ncbi:hypothetical protein H6758_00740 [Candidatus Nomurabacteria bacterium]|nr:hypothetical protein [Candidatus Nomurabacteria bacterium]
MRTPILVPWKDRPELVRALVMEGECSSQGELERRLGEDGLLPWARDTGVLVTCSLVVHSYKSAVRMRQVANGKNNSPASVAAFRDFSRQAIANAEQHTEEWPIWVRALSIHNAASGLAAWNGGDTDRQLELNLRASEMLDGVPAADRDGNWCEAARKPKIGLYEAGHIEWNLFEFMSLTLGMAKNGCKDVPGRIAFLLQRFNGDMHALVRMIIENKVGAPNQLERLAAMEPSLEALISSLAA